MTTSPQDFIAANTVIASPPLTPEISLYLATEVTPLWQATAQTLEDADVEPPFWAFAWPGGQALARYILDNPGHVAGKTVIDAASGSGIVAIAAAKAGAASVTANDIDGLAIAAISANALLNSVDLSIMAGDLTGNRTSDRWNVILAADVFYERTMATGFAAWLTECATGGAMVMASDPGRAYLPQRGVKEIAAYDVPTSLELEDKQVRRTTIWQFAP